MIASGAMLAVTAPPVSTRINAPRTFPLARRYHVSTRGETSTVNAPLASGLTAPTTCHVPPATLDSSVTALRPRAVPERGTVPAVGTGPTGGVSESQPSWNQVERSPRSLCTWAPERVTLPAGPTAVAFVTWPDLVAGWRSISGAFRPRAFPATLALTRTGPQSW